MVDSEEIKSKPNKTVDMGLTPVTIGDLLHACKKRWWWFAISVVVCLAYGMHKYLVTVPTYSRSSLVMVNYKEGLDMTSILQDMTGGNDMVPGVSNEIVTLTSPTLMMDVVKRLNLHINYSKAGRWHDTPLYGPTLPLLVEFPGWDDNVPGALRFEVLPGGKARVEMVSANGRTMENVDKTVNYLNGDTLRTSVGDFAFVLNPIFVGQVDEPYMVYVNRSPLYNTAMSLTGRIKGEPAEAKSNIIVLSLTDTDPQRAEDILKTCVIASQDQWKRERAATARQTTAFIEERIAEIERDLGSVEENIAGFKSRNLLIDPEANGASYIARANAAEEQVLALNNQLAMTRYVRDFLAAAATSNTVLPYNTGLASVNIESQIADYNRTLFERNSLAANSSAHNPVVEELDGRLEGLRRALLQSLDNHITALHTQLSSAQRAESGATGKIAASPGQALALLSQERKQKVQETLFLFLLQKREEAELAQTLVPTKIFEISAPTGSPSANGPYRDSILMMYFLIGLAIPLAIIFLKETLNNRVRHRKDLEMLKVPFAGELPEMPRSGMSKFMSRISRREEEHRGMVVRPENLDFINEAFRVLRTNVELMARHADGEDARVISLTSLYPGSGKTFVAMNLAAALAIKGRRVLLIDMDLRRFTMSRTLAPARQDNGLVDYIVGLEDSKVDNIIMRNINNVPGLDLIPTGLVPPNPSELLNEPRVAALVNELRKRYDYIIFDCPPVEVVADTLILNPLVDMTLFVIRAGLYRRSQLPMVQEMYDAQRYNSLSVVLNAAPENTDGYGYGYRYGNYRRRYHRHQENPVGQKA